MSLECGGLGDGSWALIPDLMYFDLTRAMVPCCWPNNQIGETFSFDSFFLLDLMAQNDLNVPVDYLVNGQNMLTTIFGVKDKMINFIGSIPF